MSAFTMTKEDEGALFELVLPTESTIFYHRALVKFGKQFGRDARISIDEGDQYLRRRMSRRTDYTPGTNRSSRRGFPWSGTELLMIKYSKQQNTETKDVATPEYVAAALQRDVSEIVELFYKQTNERQGIKGFDI